MSKDVGYTFPWVRPPLWASAFNFAGGRGWGGSLSDVWSDLSALCWGAGTCLYALVCVHIFASALICCKRGNLSF